MVLLFYRGGWCPYCNTTLKAYAEALPRIEAAGARDHWAAECSIGHPLPVPSFERSLAIVRKKAVEKGLDKPSTLETTR